MVPIEVNNGRDWTVSVTFVVQLRQRAKHQKHLFNKSSAVGRPLGHNRHGPKTVGAAVLLSVGGAGSPSNKIWPGPRPTS